VNGLWDRSRCRILLELSLNTRMVKASKGVDHLLGMRLVIGTGYIQTAPGSTMMSESIRTHSPVVPGHGSY